VRKLAARLSRRLRKRNGDCRKERRQVLARIIGNGQSGGAVVKNRLGVCLPRVVTSVHPVARTADGRPA